ncbi:MAG TPA: phosphonate C-P lyase system protein PhnH [Stellaceae bacterium]|jgi:alpha-D-ribose 1-methylphosphonate 5-triphosphate synthase subunit PhnH|nr:phosphonate C-P lyase system protein PhnH [Stellaceae bacterium]
MSDMTTELMPAADLLPGFSDPGADARGVFRAMLEAISYPGRVVPLPMALAAPEPLNATVAAVLLAMADLDTPVWLAPEYATASVRQYLAFHCGCPLVETRGHAAFAVVTPEDDLSGLGIGTAENPEKSAMVIVPVPWLGRGSELQLTGPGIQDETDISVPALSAALLDGFARNGATFPQGLDLVLAAPERLICLPRTTTVRRA